MRRSVFPAAVITLAAPLWLGACGGGSLPARSSTTAITTASTTTTASAPCISVGPGPIDRSASSLMPFLLEVGDVPVGYVTRGPQTSPPSGPEFYGSVTRGTPVAYIAFAMNSNPGGPGGIDQTQDGIVEALAETTSARSAVTFRDQVEASGAACGATGTTVALAGSVPNLTATESGGGSRAQNILSAIVFVVKGRYVLEVRWFNTTLTDPSSAAPTPAAPPLPPPTVIGAVVDAALARIPR